MKSTENKHGLLNSREYLVLSRTPAIILAIFVRFLQIFDNFELLASVSS